MRNDAEMKWEMLTWLRNAAIHMFDMGKKLVGVRMDEELIARIDAYAESLRREHPGLAISRGEAVRLLCEKALAASTSTESSETPETAPAKSTARGRRKDTPR